MIYKVFAVVFLLVGKVFAVVFLLVGLGLGIGIAWDFGHPRTYEYSGTAVFQTQQDYDDFKAIIGRPDVTINKAEALSSNPPIVVTFEVTAPATVTFPYGTTESTLTMTQFIAAEGLCVVIVALSIGIYRATD